MSDDDPAMPEVQHPAADVPSGRGMMIVERLADRWGCFRAGAGNVVRLELTARDDDERRFPYVRRARIVSVMSSTSSVYEPTTVAAAVVDRPGHRPTTALRLERWGTYTAGSAALIGTAVLVGYAHMPFLRRDARASTPADVPERRDRTVVPASQ